MASPDTVDKPIAAAVGNTVFPVLLAISFCHLLNDMMQSLLRRFIRRWRSGCISRSRRSG